MTASKRPDLEALGMMTADRQKLGVHHSIMADFKATIDYALRLEEALKACAEPVECAIMQCNTEPFPGTVTLEPLISALCNAHGYGALLQSVSSLWMRKCDEGLAPSGSAHTTGHSVIVMKGFQKELAPHMELMKGLKE